MKDIRFPWPDTRVVKDVAVKGPCTIALLSSVKQSKKKS